MQKWTRDRSRRRKKKTQTADAEPQAPPLQPAYFDVQEESAEAAGGGIAAEAENPEPKAEAAETPASNSKSRPGRPAKKRSRRGKSHVETQTDSEPDVAAAPVIDPGYATGEAAEVSLPDAAIELEPEMTPVLVPEPVDETAPVAPTAQARGKSQKKVKGAVVLTVGLPGSGKSTWFKRRNITPLSSDLMRHLLFDNVQEQRHQDLVFSTLRSLLRARMIARMPWNYVDATNLSPKERKHWIRMANDFGYEVHAVYFEVPLEVCMERNQRRHRVVPEDVMQRMAQKLRAPSFDEGFSKITVVRVKQAAAGATAETPESTQEAQ